MPGDIYGSQYDFGAGAGYGFTGYEQAAMVQGGGGSSSHTSFVIWLVIISLAAVAVNHGLRMGGFTFVFRR